MKINAQRESDLKEIQRLATELEIALHYFENDVPAGVVDSSEKLICIVDYCGNQTDLDLADLADGKLREAYLKA